MLPVGPMQAGRVVPQGYLKRITPHKIGVVQKIKLHLSSRLPSKLGSLPQNAMPTKPQQYKVISATFRCSDDPNFIHVCARLR
jgi:hypothetical protein